MSKGLESFESFKELEVKLIKYRFDKHRFYGGGRRSKFSIMLDNGYLDDELRKLSTEELMKNLSKERHYDFIQREEYRKNNEKNKTTN
jgi:hypothetical protein